MRVLNSKETQVGLINVIPREACKKSGKSVVFSIAMGVGVGGTMLLHFFGTLFLMIGQSFGRAIKKKEEFTNSPLKMITDTYTDKRKKLPEKLRM